MNKQFVCATKERCTFDKHIPAPYFRKAFNLDFAPEYATLSICGLGFYALYVNGKEITKGALAPYINNPDDYCYYDTYDIREFLTEGENCIGVVLGNGFFNAFAGGIWEFDKAAWIASPCFAMEFLAGNNETKCEFISDESLKVNSSPIEFDEYRMGEYYDANKEIEGWNLPGFDDSDWKTAMIAQTPRGEMTECKAEPIKIMRELKPVQIIKSDSGYIYDFGENASGVCKLKIAAKKKQKITLWHSEMIKDGKIHRESCLFNKKEQYIKYAQKDIYIAKGVGIEEYTPKFTYHGFRYVLVEGIEETQATPELLTYLVMNSDVKHIGGFECSDDVTNRLFEMVKRSDLSNFYYFPTDCPQREKNGWTADISVSAERMVLLYDVEKSFMQWLDNVRKSQNDLGAYPGIIPTGGWGFDWGNGPAWDSAMFNICYELYRKRGNTDVIRQNAHSMFRYLDYISNMTDEKGLVAIGLGDWVPVDRVINDYISPLEVTDSIMVMDIANKAREMFDIIGHKIQSEFAKSIYLNMRNAIRRELINWETMLVRGNSQTSQAMALYYGVFDKNEETEAFKRLVEIIHRDNDRFTCGVLGIRTLFHVLSKFDEAELAFDLITKPGFPSYGHLLEIGETTLPEQFLKDGEFCGSHNHHFLGDIGNWFIKCLAGLNIVENDYVEIRPHFIESLDYASAYCELPEGRVSVSWRRTEKGVKLDVVSPVEYRIIIPEKYNHELIFSN